MPKKPIDEALTEFVKQFAPDAAQSERIAQIGAALRDRKGFDALCRGNHAPTCRREITRHADDSAAFLAEKCTCGAWEPRQGR